MKGRPVDQLVYEAMFPKPRSTDVQNFQSLLHRHLILEVREEVHSFYGHLDTQEAKYPGLDYCHPIHRIRLSRWPWHRRLFRAFDNLRLTDAEIAGLTKWEGTKWAKDRFERDSGIIIRDTAADDISPWVEPEDRPRATGETPRATARQVLQVEEEEVELEVDIEEEGEEEEEEEEDEEERREDEDEDEEGEEEEEDIEDEEMEAEEAEEESDGELQSIGFALNEHLRQRAARHEAGEQSEHYEDEWEQWLKNAIESGEFPFLTDPSQQPSDTNLIPQALIPPNMLSMARAGRWDEIPGWLHDIIRRTIELERTPRNARAHAPPTPPTRSSGSMESIFERLANRRRPYSDMRLPTGGDSRSSAAGVRLQRTAQPGA
ncbi:hypothetical protein SAMD00023353_1202150 [Rosellinia necatrix]|uniref:Uncharacterized protein n=1 Tax=Rosellinia necatrix TaxID=77044 RepID=A0A1W2TKL3_ROSNE|nr:hypothetical protein SAMD00023353_1202150 [Rosellinia necatrix]